MAHDVFISHSAKDKTTADAVCAMLESSGIRCWIAPRDVTPGMEYGECIIEAIEECRIMVLVFTTNANDSPQIRREVERAVNHGVTILPVRIEDVLPGRALEYFIGNVHWLDALTPPLESHLKNLAGTVRILLARMQPHITPRPEPSAVPQPISPATPHLPPPQAPDVAQAKPSSTNSQNLAPASESFATPAAPAFDPQTGAPAPSVATGARKRPVGVLVFAILSFVEVGIWVYAALYDSYHGRFETLDTGMLVLATIGVIAGYGLIRLKAFGRFLKIICAAVDIVLLLRVVQDASHEGGWSFTVWLALFAYFVFVIWYMLTSRANQWFRREA
jgi:hypothetical protein